MSKTIKNLTAGEKAFFDGIKQRITETTKRRGTTLTTVGDRAGISSLAGYVNRDSRLSAFQVHEIARVLRVAPEWLLTGRGESGPRKAAADAVAAEPAVPSIPFSQEVGPLAVLLRNGGPVAVGPVRYTRTALGRLQAAATDLGFEADLEFVELPNIKPNGTWDHLPAEGGE